MKTVVCSLINYPVSIGKYFVHAFKRIPDLRVYTVGPFTGSSIPWKGGMNMPAKYVEAPEIITYDPQWETYYPTEYVESKLRLSGVSSVDLWVQFSSTSAYRTRPAIADRFVTVGTDPHCMNSVYDIPRRYSDVFYNMQYTYMKDGDEYLPYCYDDLVHYPMSREKEYDAALVGLGYDQRYRLVESIRQRGKSVFFDIGYAFDEYRELYAKSRVALNWSSLNDLNARTFEAMAMKIPLITNRVPDLDLFFREGEHYLGFDTVSEGTDKVMYALEHPEEVTNMVEDAYSMVEDHTYLNRCKTILSRFWEEYSDEGDDQ